MREKIDSLVFSRSLARATPSFSLSFSFSLPLSFENIKKITAYRPEARERAAEIGAEERELLLFVVVVAAVVVSPPAPSTTAPPPTTSPLAALPCSPSHHAALCCTPVQATSSATEAASSAAAAEAAAAAESEGEEFELAKSTGHGASSTASAALAAAALPLHPPSLAAVAQSSGREASPRDLLGLPATSAVETSKVRSSAEGRTRAELFELASILGATAARTLLADASAAVASDSERHPASAKTLLASRITEEDKEEASPGIACIHRRASRASSASAGEEVEVTAASGAASIAMAATAASAARLLLLLLLLLLLSP